MNKEQEIQILREAIARLGQDSYCGPWLADILPSIERDMRSDLPPIASWSEQRQAMDDNKRACDQHRAATIAAAKEQADRIISDAKDKAAWTITAMLSRFDAARRELVK